jgi:hypothetical protein
VRFCPLDDPEATLRVVQDDLGRSDDSVREAIADCPALRRRFDWDALADRKWNAIAAAWTRRQVLSFGPGTGCYGEAV